MFFCLRIYFNVFEVVDDPSWCEGALALIVRMWFLKLISFETSKQQITNDICRSQSFIYNIRIPPSVLLLDFSDSTDRDMNA